MTHEKPADRCYRIDNAKAQIANEPHWREIVGKEPVQRVRCGGKDKRIETPPLFVAAEHVRRAEIQSETRRIEHHLRKGRHILESEVQSLAGNGMDAVRRIAHQRKPRSYIVAREMEIQGIGPAWSIGADLS